MCLLSVGLQVTVNDWMTFLGLDKMEKSEIPVRYLLLFVPTPWRVTIPICHLTRAEGDGKTKILQSTEQEVKVKSSNRDTWSGDN